MPSAKRKSAFFSATQEAQKTIKQESADIPRDHESTSHLQSDTHLPSSSMTAPPSNSETVEQFSSNTALPLSSETVEQSKLNTALPSNSETAKQSNHATAKKQEKISFYLTTEQAEKLDDLAYEHKKRTGRRINRNDIVRYLIEACSIENLENLK